MTLTPRYAVVAAALAAAALICHPVLAADPQAWPPHMIDGAQQPSLPPAALAATPVSQGKVWDVSTKGFIIRWLEPSYGVNGTLDDDLIGEVGVTATCSAQPIGPAQGAPSAYSASSTSSVGRISVPYYDAPGNNTDVVQHYLTQIESIGEQDVMMLVGADDGIRVWLNGAEVLRQDAPAEYVEGALQVPVHLVDGWNLLFVKVYYPQLGPYDDQENRYQYWSLRFTETDGTTPASGIYQSVDGWCVPRESYYGWTYAPGAADVAGLFGSQWQSELRITNPYYHNLRVRLQYFANGNASGIPDGEQVLYLEPGETMLYDNVVRELTGVESSGSGTINLNGLYYNDVTRYDAVRLITANVGGDAGGSFGTRMPFSYLYDGSTSGSSTLMGLKNGPDNRTNLVVMTAPFAPDAIEVTVNLWDPESGRTATGTFSGVGAFQVNDLFRKVGMAGVTTDTAIAYLRWSSTASSAYLRFAASINDNVTSDPTLVDRGPYTVPPPFQ